MIFYILPDISDNVIPHNSLYTYVRQMSINWIDINQYQLLTKPCNGIILLEYTLAIWTCTEG